MNLLEDGFIWMKRNPKKMYAFGEEFYRFNNITLSKKTSRKIFCESYKVCSCLCTACIKILSLCLCAYNLTTAEWIFMKFGTLKTTWNSYILISNRQEYQHYGCSNLSSGRMILHDDIITHDVCLYTFNNSRMTERIFMKVDTDIVPLKTTLNSYILICYNQ